MSKVIVGVVVFLVLAVAVVYFAGQKGFLHLNFGQVGNIVLAPEIKNPQDLMDAADALDSIDLDSLDSELNQYGSDVADF